MKGSKSINIFTAIIGFMGSFRVVRGETYNPMLKLNTSRVFEEKASKYRNIVCGISKFENILKFHETSYEITSTILYLLQFELLFRRSILGPAYRQTHIEKFENGTLKVFFRIYLDRRKVPRTLSNLEDTIEHIIAKETYSISSLFKDMELDLTSISVKRKFGKYYLNF